jgi:hypothetical protein
MGEINELLKALTIAGPKIKRAAFDKVNPHFKSKYASLGSVIEAITPALEAQGLWFVQHTHNTPGFATVETVIIHASGQSLSCGVISLPIGKNDSQGWGSASTYAKRYGLCAAFGVVADDDDDGNEACAQPPAPSKGFKYEEYPEPAYPTPEVRNLGSKELAELAKRIVIALELDDAEDDMIKCLSHWQILRPLLPGIETLLSSDKQALASSFARWREKQKDSSSI